MKITVQVDGEPTAATSQTTPSSIEPGLEAASDAGRGPDDAGSGSGTAGEEGDMGGPDSALLREVEQAEAGATASGDAGSPGVIDTGAGPKDI